MTLFAEPTLALKVTTRKFFFLLSGKKMPLTDPNPNMTNEAVRQHYMGMHAELLNAKTSVERDPEGNEVVTFGTVVATKG